jgi:hypothetical protein
MTTLEGRVSRLEGAFEQFSERVNILATKDEVRAEIKAAESRIILWLVGAMLAVAALAVAGLKLIP